ncbi:MAG TPA: SMP-30/gluconolactonase/LRE family protein, partial [Dongiaceae bacterium]|nr:SMP-30/gluconolactonase/LRE family protein [Dongiaceae bacterium]
PLGLPDGSLIFTETVANRIVKIAADGTISTYQENTNGSNGLGFNPQGDLVSVQVLDPKVGIVAPAGKVKVLADKYDGTPFVRPNDLVVSSKGHVYFTDSGLPRIDPNAPPKVAPVPRPGVFHISPDGKLTRLDNSIQRPNGIQLSRDEKTLYVANTAGEHVVAFDVKADGSVGNQRNFAKLDGFGPSEQGPSSGADGLAIDDAGRLYVTSNLGIQVFDAQGKALGTIPLPQKPQNLAFAGKDKKSLYVVGRGAAYKIATLTPGFKGRAK